MPEGRWQGDWKIPRRSQCFLARAHDFHLYIILLLRSSQPYWENKDTLRECSHLLTTIFAFSSFWFREIAWRRDLKYDRGGGKSSGLFAYRHWLKHEPAPDGFPVYRIFLKRGSENVIAERSACGIVVHDDEARTAAFSRTEYWWAEAWSRSIKKSDSDGVKKRKKPLRWM